MLDDLKSALRALRASPTFTLVALTVLALGIGAGTAIFSVVDAVVLRGLPFDEHDRLAVVLEHDTKRAETFGGGTTTPQIYLDWRRLQESFEGLAAVASWTFRIHTESGEPGEARAHKSDVGVLPGPARRADSRTRVHRRRRDRSAARGSRCSATASGSGASAARRMSWARRSN